MIFIFNEERGAGFIGVAFLRQYNMSDKEGLHYFIACSSTNRSLGIPSRRTVGSEAMTGLPSDSVADPRTARERADILLPFRLSLIIQVGDCRSVIGKYAQINADGYPSTTDFSYRRCGGFAKSVS